MGVWGRKPPEASDISKNQIKWKPGIFFFKESFIFFIESSCSEIRKTLNDIWGSGGDSPQKPATFQRIS